MRKAMSFSFHLPSLPPLPIATTSLVTMSSFATTISSFFYGAFAHSISIQNVDFVKNGLLFVDNQGRIAKFLKDVHKDQLPSKLEGVPEDKVRLSPCESTVY